MVAAADRVVLLVAVGDTAVSVGNGVGVAGSAGTSVGRAVSVGIRVTAAVVGVFSTATAVAAGSEGAAQLLNNSTTRKNMGKRVNWNIITANSRLRADERHSPLHTVLRTNFNLDIF